MFSPTKVSFVTVQNLVIDLRRYFPCNRFKRGSVSNKWWSADHGLLAMDTLASLVDTLALITRHKVFSKVDVQLQLWMLANSEGIYCVCVLSSVSVSVDADFLKGDRRWRQLHTNCIVIKTFCNYYTLYILYINEIRSSTCFNSFNLIIWSSPLLGDRMIIWPPN
jgi:hypothetical protein